MLSYFIVQMIIFIFILVKKNVKLMITTIIVIASNVLYAKIIYAIFVKELDRVNHIKEIVAFYHVYIIYFLLMDPKKARKIFPEFIMRKQIIL